MTEFKTPATASVLETEKRNILYKDISYNFSVAKVLSILMVVIGHYFGGIFWIPTTFALFIFAFSSGYFTSLKYRPPFNASKFWHAKVIRLMYPILIIDIFLFFLFLIQNKPGIFTWQTLPALIGMSGILGWFRFENPSPFGGGLWFFTLLIIFYLLYPLLSISLKNRTISLIFLLFTLVSTSILNYSVPMGHMLWITVFAFIYGAFSGLHNISKLSLQFHLYSLIATFILFLLFNLVLHFSAINYFLILAASVFIIGYLLNKRLPDTGFRHSLILSGCIIQIYFIHSYLFIKSAYLPSIINFLLSIIFIISVALILNKLTEKLFRQA